MHARKYFKGLVPLSALLTAFSLATAQAADNYTLDPAHAGVTFSISHLGLSQIPGRFNQFEGAFTIDEDASKCAFQLSIKVDSVDTNNTKRDAHLRSPDFFNAKQFPVITFESTRVPWPSRLPAAVRD